MAWIELHQAVWTHRKTMILGAVLGIDDIYAAAHMCHLWCWAIDNAPGGDLGDLPDAVIARGAGWQGDPAAFVAAMQKSEYLDEDGRLHDWDEYAGRLISAREAERQRSAERRAEAKKKAGRKPTGVRPAADRKTNTGRKPDDRQTAVGTVPDRTVPNRTEPNQETVEPPNPPCGDGGTEPAVEGAPANVAAPPPDPRIIAERAYDLLKAAGHRPSNGRWVGRAIGRIKTLTPEARGHVLSALEYALAPGEPEFVGTWITACDFDKLVDRYGTGPPARAAPEPRGFAGIREFERLAREGGHGP